MLLKCPRCGTHYEVDDALFTDPTLQVQCESCDVVLVSVAKEGKIQDEKTAMLAAFDPEELEKLIGQSKAPAGPTGRSAAHRRSAAPAAAGDDPQTPPPTVSLPPYQPPAESAFVAPTAAFAPYVPGSASLDEPPPSTSRRGEAGPARRAERNVRREEDPLAAIAGAASADPELQEPVRRPQREELGETIQAMDFPQAVPPPAEEPPRRRARKEPEPEPVAPQPEEAPPRRKGRPEPRPEPVRAQPEPEEEGEEEEEEEEEAQPARRPPVRVTPVALLVIAPLLLIGLLVGSGLMLYLLFDAKEKPAPVEVKVLSYKTSLSELLKRNQGTYAATKLEQEVDQALPLFVHEDGVRIRSEEVLSLEGGHVPKPQRRGLLIKDLVTRLSQEVAPYKAPPPAPPNPEDPDAQPVPPPPPPLGKGEKTLAILAEANVPYATIGRILFTAQSVGYRTFILAGTPAEVPGAPRGLRLEKLSWYPAGPRKGGKGLGLATTPDGYVIFERSGTALPPVDVPDTRDEKEKDQVKVPRTSSSLGDLYQAIKTINSDERYKDITIQPSATMTYEQLLGLMERLAGVEGERSLFQELVLSGAEI